MGHEGMLEVLDFSRVLTSFRTDFQFGGGRSLFPGGWLSLCRIYIWSLINQRDSANPWEMGSDHWAFSGYVVLGTLLSCLNLQCSCSKVRSSNAFCLARCQD